MDTNLSLRLASAGNLTADETLSDVLLGPMVKPVYLHTNIPSVSSGDTFNVQAAFKAGSTVLKTDKSAEYSVAGHYVLEIFCDAPTLTKLVVTNDVTKDTTAAASFGAVVQWLSNSRVS